jgi:hypothetical protein
MEIAPLNTNPNANRYNDAKIYVIRSNKTPKIYIGSTIYPLSYRFSIHKNKYNKSSSSVLLKEYDDCFIELLEAYPCNNRGELCRREGHHINQHRDKVVNKSVAGRSSLEYINANRAVIYEYNRQWKKTNRAAMNEYQNKWRAAKRNSGSAPTTPTPTEISK